MPKFLLPNKKILWGRVSMLQRNREELPLQMAKTMHHHAPLPKNFKFRRPRLFLRIQIIKIKYTDTVEHNILVKQEKNN